MPASPKIFKAYDIRGLYGDDIDGDTAERIGRAFVRVIAQLAGKPAAELTLGLGQDVRLSAPELAGRYRDGMASEGARVVDAGQVGTEMLYFLVGSRGLDGGLMCTASHNPKQYTGAKLVREGAIPLSGEEGIDDIRDLVLGSGLPEQAPGGGTVTTVDIYDDFHAKAISFIDPTKIDSSLKVVVDGSDGIAGRMVGPLLTRLGLDVTETFWKPDGNFPGHGPNPMLPEGRQLLIDKVRETDADLGIAWDGDADRCFLVDDQGTFVDGDFLTAILAEHLLHKDPGSTILYDCRASRAVPDTVTAAGGTPEINRVGHAFFKTRMKREGSLFGGEVSGHYYFREFFCADSGTLPALLMLEKLSVEGRKLSELVAPYHAKYFISGEINSTVADAPAKLAELEERYGSTPGAKVTHVDGVSVDWEDWHFNVRSSNTEPLLRLCLESLVSVADMEAKRDEVLGVIRA